MYFFFNGNINLIINIFLRFKVEFLDDKSICFTKEILSKEKADEILSKKIDWSKLSKEDTTSDNLDFSRNLVPLEENKNDDFQLKEKVETALRKNEEIPAENKFNELILKEQNEFKEEDEIQKKFRKM